MSMGNNPILRRAVRTALLSGSTVAGLMSHYSLAQAQAAPAAAAEAAPPITEVGFSVTVETTGGFRFRVALALVP